MDNHKSITIIPLESLPKQAFLNGRATVFTLSSEEVETLKNYYKKASMNKDSEIIDEPHSKSR